MRTARILALLLAALASLSAARAAQPVSSPLEEEEVEPFGEVISVSLLTFRARILDSSGAPLTGLTPADLAVRVGDRAVPVLAVDFVDQAVDPADSADARLSFDTVGTLIHQASSKGQLFVVFVEAGPENREPPLKPRQLRARIPLPLKRLLAALEPEDRVAVVAHTDRLVPVLDWSRDRDAVWQAVERSVRHEMAMRHEVSAPPAAAGAPSLLPVLGGAGAGEAASSAEALARLAEALIPLPGEKVVLYLAVDDGRFPSGTGAAHPSEMDELLDALSEARATVFVLARDRALTPPAKNALATLSASTGGLYLACTDGDADRLARAVDGYHVVSLDADEVVKSAAGTRITVELAGRQGTVLMAPMSVFKGYE